MDTFGLSLAAASAACGLMASSSFAGLPLYVIRDVGTLAGPSTRLEPGSVGVSIAAGRSVGYSVTSLEQRNFHAFRTAPEGLIDLGVLSGDEHSIGFGINDAGDVVGVSYALGELNCHGVLWSASGGVTELGTLEPRDINSSGSIAGSKPVAGALGTSRAVRRIGSTATDLGTLGGMSSMAFAISESNWVVGQSLVSNNTTTRAFVVADGAMIGLGALGGTNSRALDINGLTVVGIADLPGDLPRATRWTLTSAGTVATKVDLGVLPGTVNSAAYSVNAAGAIVGISGDSAVLWKDGVMSDLNDLIAPGGGWRLQRASGIDDAGRIVGTGKRFGLQRAFMLTPRAPADLDADGLVGPADLAILLGAWGASAPDFDLTGDGVVGPEDLGILLGSWGG